jgi:NADH dehydrogenase/NADH:ubiquinone oxidoreductase subunit G
MTASQAAKADDARRRLRRAEGQLNATFFSAKIRYGADYLRYDLGLQRLFPSITKVMRKSSGRSEMSNLDAFQQNDGAGLPL